MARIFATERKALEWRRTTELEFEQEEVNVTTAIDRYEAAELERGPQPQSVATTKYRLLAFFGKHLHAPLGDLTAKQCRAAYDRLRGMNKVDTHRNTLSAARTFMAWATTQRMTSDNPVAGIAGKGRRSRGKEQLRIDEARRLDRVALELAGAGDRGGLAVELVLVLGLRAGEVVAIRARDVDDHGQVLVIPKAKTRAGVRRLEIPEVLRAALVPLVPKAGPLFPGQDRHWVRREVARLCGLAKVPVVTAHGLRGTHASLATDRGASGPVVAASLGHGDGGRTAERNYIDPAIADQAKQRAAFRVLQGGAG